MDRRTEIGKDRTLLEHLVRKYGRDDIDRFLNEGRFGDAVRRGARRVMDAIKKIGNTIVSVFAGRTVVTPLTVAVNFQNETLPMGVTVIPSEHIVELAADQGIDIDRNVGIADLDARISDDIREVNAYWRDFIDKISAGDGVSEHYVRKMSRRASRMNEAYDIAQARIIPDDAFIKLESNPELGLEDINTEDFEDLLYSNIKRNLLEGGANPIMVWGAPGIGKTAIIHGILKELSEDPDINHKLTCIDTCLSKMDYDDFSLSVPDANHTKVVELVKSWLPMYEPTNDPETDAELDRLANCSHGSEGGGVLFFDELSRANRGVLNVIMNLVNEGNLGNARLGSKWYIIAAGNRPEDMRDADISWENAFGRRWTQYNFVPDFNSWIEWATKSGIDKDIIGFLQDNKDAWYLGADAGAMTAGQSPASWAKLSDEFKTLRHSRKYIKGSNNGKDAEFINGQKMQKFFGVMGTDVTPATPDAKGWNGQKVVGNVGQRFNDYLNLFAIFPKKYCEDVWTKGDKVPITFNADNPSNVSRVVEAIVAARPGNHKVNPTPEEFENYVKWLMQITNQSMRALAWSNGVKLIRNQTGMFAPNSLRAVRTPVFKKGTTIPDHWLPATPEQRDRACDPKDPGYNEYYARIRQYVDKLGAVAEEK